jgi:hypothetical protein
MDELMRMFRRLEKLPQAVVVKAARHGTAIARKAAKANAPVDSGELKSGIVQRQERRTKLGKAMFDVIMNASKNQTFVKMTKSGVRYYYPASQEYGYRLKDGGYMPGLKYMSRALSNNYVRIQRKIVEVGRDEVEKIMRKR